jgi:hypothetical protein
MTLSWIDLVDEINKFCINLTRNKIFKDENDDFLLHVQKCLKLNKKEDWNYILGSEDILEDTNLAIKEFLKFGISGPTKYQSLGEKYLRLYGVLNAIYLQQQAILNIHKFFNCQNNTELREKFSLLGATALRHKLGSHSANFDCKNTSSIQIFVPVRFEFGDFSCAYSNPINDEYHTVDLKASIEEHLKLVSDAYLTVSNKMITTIYKSNKDKIAELESKLEPFSLMLSGKLITKIANSDSYSVISAV